MSYQHQSSGRIMITAVVISFFAISNSYSQNLSTGARVMPGSAEVMMNGMPIMRPASQVVGNTYFNSRPSQCTITLYENDQVINGYFARFNIYFNELDVKTQNGERALDGSKVKAFVMKDTLSTTFVNGHDFALDGTPLKGFLEVLVDGPAPLYKFNYVIIKEPDWSPVLNSGSRDTRILKAHKFYHGNGKDLLDVKGKKKMLESFGDKSDEVAKFAKINIISFSDQEGMVKIYTYYNSLLTAKN